MFEGQNLQPGIPRLLIVGGADRSPEIYNRFISMCRRVSGAPDTSGNAGVSSFPGETAAAAPSIGVLTCASAEPETSYARIAARLKAAGAGSIVHLKTDDTAKAAGALVGLQGLWFTGGDQEKLYHALFPRSAPPHPLVQEIKAALTQELVLCGTSAGAAVMSDPMIYEGDSHTSINNAAGVSTGPGLGCFVHGLIDQHFDERGRLIRLCRAMARHGIRRGFGIGEDSALQVEGTQLSVAGSAGVLLVEHSKAGKNPPWMLSYMERGDRLSLAGTGSESADVQLEFPGKKSTHGEEVLDSHLPLSSGVLSPHGSFRKFIARELLDNSSSRIYPPDETGHPYIKSLLLKQDVDGLSYHGAELRFYRIEGHSRGYYADDGGLAFRSVGFNWKPLELVGRYHPLGAEQ